MKLAAPDRLMLAERLLETVSPEYAAPFDPAWEAELQRRAAEMEQSDDVLLTTDYCVDETLTLLVARKRPVLAIEAGQAFFDEELAALHFLTADQIRRAWILFRVRHATGWSFTDCTSKIVMTDAGIATAAALDKHFSQMGIGLAL